MSVRTENEKLGGAASSRIHSDIKNALQLKNYDIQKISKF